jgi:hypothetical protein
MFCVACTPIVQGSRSIVLRLRGRPVSRLRPFAHAMISIGPDC